MKPAYIFLDVDGVLNSLRTCVAYGSYRAERLDGTAIRLVDHLCASLARAGWRPRIVLSSTWRLKHPDMTWWEDLFGSHGCGATEFCGATDDFRDIEPNRRGREVAAWMAKNAPGEAYVCLDDDSDFLPGQPLVLTSHIWGLGCDEIDDAYHLITGQRLFMSTLRTDSKWRVARATAQVSEGLASAERPLHARPLGAEGEARSTGTNPAPHPPTPGDKNP